MVIPELVVREVVGRYRAELTTTTEKARTVDNELTRLGVPILTPAINLNAAVADYEHALRAAIDEANGKVERPPNVTILDLADRAIGRKRPFDAKGGGFRDAVVWEHVVGMLVKPWEHAALVTNDNAFKEPNGELAVELRDELEERGFNRDAVTVAATIADYLRISGTDDPEALDQVAVAVESEQDQITASVRSLLRGADAEPMDESAATIAVEPRDWVRVVVEKATAHETADNLLLVDLDVAADVDLFIEAWEPIRATLVARDIVHVSASATFDKQHRVLDNISLGTIGVDVSELADDAVSW